MIFFFGFGFHIPVALTDASLHKKGRINLNRVTLAVIENVHCKKKIKAQD